MTPHCLQASTQQIAALMCRDDDGKRMRHWSLVIGHSPVEVIRSDGVLHYEYDFSANAECVLTNDQ
jgi:hypothetical protein